MPVLWNKNFWNLGIIFCYFVFFSTGLSFSETMRKPFFAGSFYPADEKQLKLQVMSFLKGKTTGEMPAGIIVPHAGYIYSGKTAGSAYSLIKDKKIDTVFLIGRSHRASFLGIVTDDRGFWKSPLGDVKVDTQLVSEIVVKPGFRVDYRILDAEHSLEVQIPFLQCTIRGEFKIVPILVGCENASELNNYVEYLFPFIKKQKNSIIVMSTDLSHYYFLDVAKQKDSYFISLLESGKFSSLMEEMQSGKAEACGGSAVYLGLKILSKVSQIKVKLLNYSTSYDATKDNSNVVGYAAMAVFFEKKTQLEDKTGGKMLNRQQRETLLKIARQTIEYHLSGKKLPQLNITDPVLCEKRGVFVTLRKKGELRGCIGMILPRERLIDAVKEMAIESATGDPRFPPVALKELKDIEIEISVLTVPTKVSSPDEIVLGRDGVIVKKGFRQGVFLPQVADETGWTKEQFLSALCEHKAGLEPDAWKKPDTELYTFQAEVFSEKEF
ncbi:MAG TPA: AmmeMemoRadiSam system protein B [bacterium]|nr:AmmeMemoRadiSam system protein B [bacterium]HOL35347.1 AmmeMemoRadiSam system protein B [bacterium]HPP08526.1 AmmeMemoRadiSam system protein B [bacterium]